MNRVLFHVEPLVMHGRPFHYWAWLARAAALSRHLAGSGAWQVRIALNAALATRAVAPHDPARTSDPRNGQGLPREWLAVFHQEELRASYGAPNVAILEGLHHGRWPVAAVAAHAAVLRAPPAPRAPATPVRWGGGVRPERAVPQPGRVPAARARAAAGRRRRHRERASDRRVARRSHRRGDAGVDPEGVSASGVRSAHGR